MSTKIGALVVAMGLLAGVGVVPSFSQTADHSHVDKMAAKVSRDEMIAKMGKMSTDDKAVMIDEMSAKDKRAAMKMSGHDTSKMSAQQKADMFDKMTIDKKISMMMAHQAMVDKSAERARRG